MSHTYERPASHVAFARAAASTITFPTTAWRVETLILLPNNYGADCLEAKGGVVVNVGTASDRALAARAASSLRHRRQYDKDTPEG